MNYDILLLFASLDAFCQAFEPASQARLLASGTRKRHRRATLALSEVLKTVVIYISSSSDEILILVISQLSQHP